jgi:hypothetical protein
MSKAAALLAWAPGLGFGLPCIYGIWYLADRGHVWTFMGFPTYGGGPFEGIGVETTVPLLVAFLLVCVAEMVAGWLLWRNQRAGGLLALALLPVEFAFWIGFALPLGPVVVWSGPAWSSWPGPNLVTLRPATIDERLERVLDEKRANRCRTDLGLRRRVRGSRPGHHQPPPAGMAARGGLGSTTTPSSHRWPCSSS